MPRQAAQVVLMDDDFSHMKQIISEGRRDINNITRSATLFLYKNLFSMLLYCVLHHDDFLLSAQTVPGLPWSP